tara:strand:- start:4990 stop:5622 length:633 start_codon:yes stop_codon:yes gene_type:complete
VNGLASLTLSIFNMDHPNDRAWLKKVFDVTVGQGGDMRDENITDFLNCFYRARSEGPTLSGGYVPLFPPKEGQFLSELCAAGPVPFATLMEALMAAQENYTEPEAPLEYNSNALMCNDKIKHTRRVLGPQQQFRKPMTTSQEVGWELGATVPGDMRLLEVGKHPFHLRTSATTQFSDAEQKHTWGRSIGGEFSAYAARKLLEFGGFGIGI